MTLYVLTSGEYDDYHIVCHLEGETDYDNFSDIFYLKNNYFEFFKDNNIEYRMKGYSIEYKVILQEKEYWLSFYDPEYTNYIPSYLKWFAKKYNFKLVEVQEIHL